MRKSDKKRDNQVRIALTDVCESALKDIDGFRWLTHLVNYSRFPDSLKVVCVFDTNEQLSDYFNSQNNDYIQSLITFELTALGITINNPAKHIFFDTEENCAAQHNGNWASRLKS